MYYILLVTYHSDNLILNAQNHIIVFFLFLRKLAKLNNSLEIAHSILGLCMPKICVIFQNLERLGPEGVL